MSNDLSRPEWAPDLLQGTAMKPADPKAQQPKKKIQKRMLCPFVQSPHKDCYFLDMNSNKISMAVYYCRNHYHQCEIYKRMTRQKKNKPEGDKKRNGENNREP